MRRGVVVLKDMVAAVPQEGIKNGPQHFPDVTLGGDAPTSSWLEIKKHGPQQIITATYMPPHIITDCTTTLDILLRRYLGSEKLTTNAPDSGHVVSSVHAKPALITEQYVVPLLPPVDMG